MVSSPRLKSSQVDVDGYITAQETKQNKTKKEKITVSLIFFYANKKIWK